MAKELPALPCGANDGSTPVLDASSGGTIAMDHLGPIVVNEDGTLSRITNWENLSEGERAVARRRIAARNKERLDRLRTEEKEN